MDRPVSFHDQTVFCLTGKRTGDALAALPPDFRPALFAPFGDLTRLRYDFPVILVDGESDGAWVVPLTNVIGALGATVAPRGIEGERLRRQLLRLERELRARAAAGAEGTLSVLWAQAADAAAAGDAAAAVLLRQCAASLPVDGPLVDCDAALAARFVRRAWEHDHAARAARFHAQADRLVLALSDILRAARAHSLAGLQPQALQESFGTVHRDAFDFTALSRYVSRNLPADELPAARRRRIETALDVLARQRFYPAPGVAGYDFVFTSCDAALAAHRERLPELVAVVRALAVAELEARGAYVESRHDAVFESFDAEALRPEDLARFPPALVLIAPERNDAPENAALMQMLSGGLPVKVLVQHTDLLEDAAAGQGRFAFGVRSARLATAVMGLGGQFVLQTASANLVALRDRVAAGMAADTPALYSVYVGAPPQAGSAPRYLTAAAAMKSRAFPAFSYDAAAGTSWATRFRLENNRHPEQDWAVETLAYADDELQRAQTAVAFTYADFVLCDARHAHHFAVVPRARWSPAMIPAADWLALPEAEAAERVPYLLAVDARQQLHRVLVDARLMQATRRCLLLWRRLQEHGGVHDAYATRAVERARAQWESAAAPASLPADAAVAPIAPEAALTAETAPPPGPDAHAVAAAPSADEPWIETARCSTCNECRNINDRMFGYNANQQAFIQDISAGTYRQLVEAAEACQVAIIHPGKPKNPQEPGLEALIERARPFL